MIPTKNDKILSIPQILTFLSIITIAISTEPTTEAGTTREKRDFLEVGNLFPSLPQPTPPIPLNTFYINSPNNIETLSSWKPVLSSSDFPATNFHASSFDPYLNNPHPQLHNIEVPSSALNSYYSNGRLVKQYEVIERYDEGINQFFENSLGDSQSFARSYGFIHPTLNGRNLQQNQVFSIPLNYNFLSTFDGKPRNPKLLASSARQQAQGPVALGSGSLGYIRNPNGGIYLGSGSLGYINGQQSLTNLNTVPRRQNILVLPGPLNFGHTL